MYAKNFLGISYHIQYFTAKKVYLHLSGVIWDDYLQWISATFVPIKTQTDLWAKQLFMG